MNLLKDIIIDFVLFSGIEGFIFCLFFEKIGDCKKFKWYEWLILSVGNCLISQLLPPTIYQAFMVLWMTFLLYMFNKDKSVKYLLEYSALSLFMFFIYEVIYSILVLYILHFDSLVTNLSFNQNIKLFIIMLPIRLIEISSVLLYYKTKKEMIT